MPELPEVETTRRGISPHILGQTIAAVHVRQPRLRWPVTEAIGSRLAGHPVRSVERRGKYLVLRLDTGFLLIHLGMSGSLRILPADAPAGRHDHVDIIFNNGRVLRYTDPRRFGCLLWGEGDSALHPLLAGLGPEPLTPDFTAEYLHTRARGRKLAVKLFIMDSQVVVGVGNIYANEALFMSGIDPRRPAGRIAARRYITLVENIRQVLSSAIAMGGTTLRDFVGGTGQPGYFRQSLLVYGRGDQPCLRCGATLRELRLGQRSTVFCPTCQT